MAHGEAPVTRAVWHAQTGTRASPPRPPAACGRGGQGGGLSRLFCSSGQGAACLCCSCSFRFSLLVLVTWPMQSPNEDLNPTLPPEKVVTQHVSKYQKLPGREEDNLTGLNFPGDVCAVSQKICKQQTARAYHAFLCGEQLMPILLDHHNTADPGSIQFLGPWGSYSTHPREGPFCLCHARETCPGPPGRRAGTRRRRAASAAPGTRPVPRGPRRRGTSASGGTPAPSPCGAVRGRPPKVAQRIGRQTMHGPAHACVWWGHR